MRRETAPPSGCGTVFDRIYNLRNPNVEVVDRPGGIAEEAMISAVVPAPGGARGLDQLGDVAVAVGEAPPGGDGEEGGEGGCREDGSERE